MDCEASEEIIQNLHENSIVGDLHLILAMEHMITCEQCQSWFTQNMCPKIENAVEESLIMMHHMLHEPLLGHECRYF